MQRTSHQSVVMLVEALAVRQSSGDGWSAYVFADGLMHSLGSGSDDFISFAELRLGI
jgi:hypothetical protein